MISDLEQAIQTLESAHQKLISGNPEDFDVADAAARERGTALANVVEALKLTELAEMQIVRLKRVNLDGLLHLERIRLARQGVRGELAAANQQGQVLSGYQSGSADQS